MALDLDATIAGLGPRPPRCPRGAMRRVVLRFDRGELERIDALRARLPKSSRAAIVRAFCLLGAALMEKHLAAKETNP
jgi:hypothetical protein